MSVVILNEHFSCLFKVLSFFLKQAAVIIVHKYLDPADPTSTIIFKNLKSKVSKTRKRALA